jgi:riboflavin kinase / FMN adenylyltransferase
MRTTLIRSLYNLTPAQQRGVLTIGNFDGVHKGHQHLLAKVIEKARACQVPSIVMTFEPHPFEFFAGQHLTIPRLTRLKEKFYALAACGVDNVLILPFNQKLAKLSARDFVTNVIYNTLKPLELVIGDDFHFGYQRQGEVTLLRDIGAKLGFSVEAMETILIDGERVSSTRVRKALSMGDHDLVKRLLGRPYAMLGRIRRGDQRGRQLGFPTANIFLHRRLSPVRGVYTVYVEGIADHPWPGVANIGSRPTIDGTQSLLEVHLLDFNQDIYGRNVSVLFGEKLRDEMRFPNLDLLREQIAKDVLAARRYFQQTR